MKKSGILMIATILAAGISSASAAEINFDGGSLAAGNLGEMLAGSTGIEAVEASRPEFVPMTDTAEGAPFMNEQACAILDAQFLVQPAKEEAVEMLQPCLADISSRYGAALKLASSDKGLNLLVGDAKNPGKGLQAALRVQLKVKANGQFFGHNVALFVPRVSANKDWLDDYNTVVEYVSDNTAIDGAMDGAALGAVAGMGNPAAIVVGAVIGAVVDAWDD